MKSLLILGAGGFGRMIKETALALGYEEVLFLDDTAKDDDVIGRCCDYHLYHRDYSVAVAAFGNNKTRLFWTQKLLEEAEVPNYDENCSSVRCWHEHQRSGPQDERRSQGRGL